MTGKSLTIIPPLPKDEFDRLVKLWRTENTAFLNENGDAKFTIDVLRAEGGKNLFSLRMMLD
jgi:hypothetical protein